ncbi:hypothetical protein, partial [Asanoa sp. NPDC050611]|uniref:hypothetical protein n=1 Tax=Asanoa sp. NPDC050611 TaxID=3157098 RepID=UPI0033C372D6
MNSTDLREVLESRSADSAEHVMHHLRLHGVRAKVRRRRRQRVAAWAAAGVAVALASAAAVVTSGSPAPAPAGPPTLAGFPEYAQGARAI